MREEHEQGITGSRVPWAFILDPASNARALGNVQRRGLQAAREVVDRVVSTMNRPDEPQTGAAWNGAASGSTGRDVPLEDLVRAWWELAAQILSALTGGQGVEAGPAWNQAAPGSMVADVMGQVRPDPWRLQADPKGQLIVPAELWLYNPSPDTVGPLRLRVGDLYASDGTPLAAICVRFDPPEVTELPPRSARGVVVTLLAEEPFSPGTYRGVVQAEGAPNLWITLEITVKGQAQ